MSRRTLPKDLVARVRRDSRERCGYCLSPRHLVMARLEIEHIVPVALGGSDDESNLWLSCPLCNRYKGDRIEAIDPLTDGITRLFNPRCDAWFEHFEWSKDGCLVIGRTDIGRATVAALRLDSDVDAITVRASWVNAGWHPPTD